MKGKKLTKSPGVIATASYAKQGAKGDRGLIILERNKHFKWRNIDFK
jgi:hypothetical protein